MKKSVFVLLLIVVFSRYGNCQQADAKRLERKISEAIAKARPACVRIWGYDTVANQRTSAQFSGVVVDNQGSILTAAHVTTPGNTYKVMFPDGRECLARALGKIELSADRTRPDASVMKIISKGNWPFAGLGSSANLKQFEPCISISYPESLPYSFPVIRFGYIAAVINPRGFIQSTCKMEPGDSGGPLFDYMGHVIGLHSAIEVGECSNYEVPVDVYKKYWTALNIPAIYHSFPELTDRVRMDSSGGKIISLSKLKNMALFTGTSKFKKGEVGISSNLNGRIQKAAGTLFSLKGLDLRDGIAETVIVTKSSLVGKDPQVIGPGRNIPARIISRDRDNDMVLLQPVSDLKGGIKFADLLKDTLLTVRPGGFLISPLLDTACVVGIIGSAAFDLPRIANAGFLGATAVHKRQPVSILWIKPGSPADLVGIKVGDELISVNGILTKKDNDFSDEIQKYWPGDTLLIALKRSGTNITKNVVLGVVPKIKYNHPAEAFTGGKSERRDGFKKAFSTDATITADRCGGPVFDLDLHFCGINIARYSRVSCIVIPTSVILKFIIANAKA
ncbi:MAG: trypsin-like peptidase domain-containing protein [Bacteroidota bacterium]|nr:trypsin-like peptidase domain-containing protein [Bacteroidota bacterium]